MRGFRLTAENELALTSGGRLIPIDGVEAAAQEIATRWRMFRGEWFLDLREGVPHYQEILRKNPSASARIQQIARELILSVPGILDVAEVTVTVDRASREARIDFEARYQDGAVIRSEDFGPLLIAPGRQAR